MDPHEVIRQIERFMADAAALSESDRALLRQIDDDVVNHRLLRSVKGIRLYYQDYDRAERTPRSILYLHIGILCGLQS